MTYMIDGAHWFRVTKTDPRAVGLYRRHYSAMKNHKTSAQLRRAGIAGSGESITLMTPDGLALFGWRHDIVPRKDGQIGVNCTIFRNEGPILSSALIQEADDLCWQRWPGQRLFTYVGDSQIRSTNPGFCFQQAGWAKCGRNGDGRLSILECFPG